MRNEPAVTVALAADLGLSEDEFARIHEALGRAPTYTELCVFSVMWSEHCSYKSSRLHLAKLPTEAPHVLQGPGENAGIVDIGGGWAAAFKMESHNHPSYIEPFQGAATGSGGIFRDVFTMGARVVACLDSLRFGSPSHGRTRYLVNGVVSGIAFYGNCMGVPTVGGECSFDTSYDGNNLVNVFALGVVRHDRIFLGKAGGPGNPVIYVGSRTGRDGIHGATMASEEFSEDAEAKRPTVQVGDPFAEKLLMEACLELMEEPYLVGIQDMGAAGLTSSSFEMASRAGTGLVLDLDAVPRREEGMTPDELLLSESQERMLMVVERGHEAEAMAIFERWDLQAEVVGEVTDTGRVEILFEGEVVADLPVDPIVDMAPKYDRPVARPAYLDSLPTVATVEVPEPADPGATLVGLIGSPDLASKAWIWEQYDHMVGTNTVLRPGADAAVLRVKEHPPTGLAMSVDCRPEWCWLDPYEGAYLTVVEAVRNLACAGAIPLGATDCLNYGNPEKPEVMWTIVQGIEGMAAACRDLGVPIVSGNVSLYNETDGVPIKPTPTIAVVGSLPDVDKAVGATFDEPGDVIYLVGAPSEDMGGSVYLREVTGQWVGPCPRHDLAVERALAAFLREGATSGLFRSAHDVSRGGIAAALATSAISRARGPLGATVSIPSERRRDFAWFSETPGRAVISCRPADIAAVESLATSCALPLSRLGTVEASSSLTIDDVPIPLEALFHAWRHGLVETIGL